MLSKEDIFPALINDQLMTWHGFGKWGWLAESLTISNNAIRCAKF